jgi:hypothetical protein
MVTLSCTVLAAIAVLPPLILAQGPAGVSIVQFSGAPVPYDWGTEFVTTLSKDAEKYEEQLSALLDSPLSDWETFPRVRSISRVLSFEAAIAANLRTLAP